MFPAALAIVLNAFPVTERGRAMAIFFAVAGGLTSIGPLAGGYLTEWTWRAIFWVNIPVAIVALVLTAISKPDDEKHPAPLDYRGTVLVSGGMGLAVLGLQQSSVWGWAIDKLPMNPTGPRQFGHLKWVLHEIKATKNRVDFGRRNLFSNPDSGPNA